MPDALLVIPPFVLAGVLVWSGIAKLRRPGTLDDWARLGVPAVLRTRWLLRVHPWAEIALALALIVLGGWLGALAALACLGLMSAYLVLVTRALRSARESSIDPTCSCFGDEAPISAVTIVRNAWLVLLSAIAVVALAASPIVGGAIAATVRADTWTSILGAAIAAATVVLVRWPESRRATAPLPPLTASAGGEAPDDESDYFRMRTPAVPIQLADGTVTDLRTLSSRRPQLIVAVTTTCGACLPVIEAVPAWRGLVPEVEIRLLLSHAPEQGAFAEREEPQSLHDPNEYVRRSIEEWGTPTALLLGADGMLAGGPVTGSTAVELFVEDIRASLDELRAEPRAVSESGSASP